MKDFFKNKRVLVTGSTGLIGRQLSELLVAFESRVTSVSLDKLNKADPLLSLNINHIHGDLRDYNFCNAISKNQDLVFHLAGIKGSPLMTSQQPSSFFVNTLMFNLNMIEASRKNKVKNFLYTSTVGVYSPAEIMYEDDVWATFPSKNDRFAGWAKRMGELQIEAAQIEYGWEGTHIVRPANVYGPWDNFDSKSSMVIPSLISRMIKGEKPLVVWGDGSTIRDFVYCRDVALAMIFVMANGINQPVNIGSGIGISIKSLIEKLRLIHPNLEVAWDLSKPTGDSSRVLDMSRLFGYGFKLSVDIDQGLKHTYDWYSKNKSQMMVRYDAFEE